MASPALTGYEETAVPTLKVMRLQSPDLEQPTAGSMESRFLMGCSLALPDSFGVIHVGETFTAYLGAVNVSPSLMVRRLSVTAQLQTPSHRHMLPSKLENPMGIDVNPGDGVDAIVAQKLEESGQHILRVEVGYKATEGNQKTLRKFYRFNVSDPLTIVERTVRTGDNACFVSLSVENVSLQPMVIQSVDFQARDGLAATQIGGQSTSSAAYQPEVSAAQLFDGCGRLEPKSAFRYLFRVETAPSNDTLKGIACGDQLGKAVISWRKTMGERGECVSGPIQCPTIQPPGLGESKPSKSMMNSPYVVQGSGLSIDVAAVAANRAARRQQASNLDQLLPITVEPIDPPSSMKLACPEEVQFLVVNHSTKPMKLQLQFRLNHMSGVAVCGKSYRNLGEIAPSGGSTVVGVRLLALVAGLLRVQGCCVSEIETGREIVQPPLFNVFVGPSIAEQ